MRFNDSTRPQRNKLHAKSKSRQNCRGIAKSHDFTSKSRFLKSGTTNGVGARTGRREDR